MKPTKRIGVLLISISFALLSVCFESPAAGILDSLKKGLEYLNRHLQPDGSCWEGGDPRTTAFSLRALREAGLTGVEETQAAATGLTARNTLDLAYRVMAVRSEDDADALEALKSDNGAYDDDVFTTAMAILSLKQAGRTDTEAVDWLLIDAPRDAGNKWNGGPEVLTNATILLALLEAGVSPANPVVADNVSWLRSRQNPPGDFDGAPFSTAIAALALHGADATDPLAGQALEYLEWTFTRNPKDWSSLDVAGALLAFVELDPADPMTGRLRSELVSAELPGHVFGETTTRLRDTAAAARAFSVVEDGLDGLDRTSAWCSAIEDGTTADVALAVDCAAPGNRVSQSQILLLRQRIASTHGFVSLPGYPPDPLSTAVTITALRHSGGDDGTLSGPAIDWLATQVSQSGGWAAFPNGEQDPVVTARVLEGMTAWTGLRDTDTLLANGFLALEAYKNPDGGFGLESGTSDPGLTSAVLTAFLLGGKTAGLGEGTVFYLVDSQGENGSWGDTFTTAEAVRALSLASRYPNLRVSADRVILTPDPAHVPYEWVTIQAAVENTGGTDLRNVRLRIEVQAPQPDGDDAVFPKVLAGGSRTFSFTWTTGGAHGSFGVTITADPDGQIQEFEEGDNAVTVPLTVPLPAVSGFEALAESETVTLQWDPTNPAYGAAGYRLECSDRTVPLTGLDPYASTSFEDKDVVNNGVYTYTVRVIDADATAGFPAVVVAVPTVRSQGKDLTVRASQTRFSSETPMQGDDVVVTTEVHNIGDTAVTETFSAKIYHDSQDPSNLIGEEVIAGLASGGFRSFSKTWEDVPEGSHTVIVVADAGNVVDEGANEGNNTAQKGINATALPDLAAGDFTVEPLTPLAREPIGLNVALSNVGGTTASWFTVNFFNGDPEDPNPQVLASGISVRSLAPGEPAKDVSVKAVRLDAGDYVLCFKADTESEIQEASETNNTLCTTSIHVAGRPDLQAVSVSIDPVDPQSGNQATVSWTVKNIGETASQADIAIMFHDGDPRVTTPFRTDYVPALDLNEEYPGSFLWTRPDAGVHDIVAVVDPDLDETNEHNNIKHQPVLWSNGADLAVRWYDIEFDPWEPETEGDVGLSARVYNQGRTASPSGVTVNFNRLVGKFKEQVFVGSASLGAVAPGSSGSVLIVWENAPYGSHEIQADVVLSDADTTNNNAARILDIMREDDIATSAGQMWFSNGIPRDGETITVFCEFQVSGDIPIDAIHGAFFVGDPRFGDETTWTPIKDPAPCHVKREQDRQITFLTSSATWDTTGFEGERQIIFILDPEGDIDEVDETNNMAVKSITVTSTIETPQITGTIHVTPPLIEEGTAITPSVFIENTGNADLSGFTATLSIFFDQEISAEHQLAESGLNLNRGQTMTVEFDSVIPDHNGRYRAVLTTNDSEIDVSVPALTIPVGPYAVGTMTIEPATLPVPGGKVVATIALTSENSLLDANDEFVQEVKDTIRYGINWEEEKVQSLHKRDTCICCHIQPQGIVSFELSRDVDGVDLDPVFPEELFHDLVAMQEDNGSMFGRSSGGYPTLVSKTVNFLWGIAFRQNIDDSKDALRKGCEYLLDHQENDGRWLDDQGQGGFFPFLTADAMVAYARAYQLTGDARFWDALVENNDPGKQSALRYVLATYDQWPETSNNVEIAGRIAMALDLVFPLLEGHELEQETSDLMDEIADFLISSQRSDDHGWTLLAGAPGPSEIRPTAHALYALGRLYSRIDNPQKEQKVIDAIGFVLQEKIQDSTTMYHWGPSDIAPPGSCVDETTWAIIALPIILPTLEGLDVDLKVTLDENAVRVDSVSDPWSEEETTGNQRTMTWTFAGVPEQGDGGKDVFLYLDIPGLTLDEERPVALNAELSYFNTFTNQAVVRPIEVPSVLGVSPATIDIDVEEPEYGPNEDAVLTCAIHNVSHFDLDLDTRIVIQDAVSGALVDEVGTYPIRSLIGSVLPEWLYRVRVDPTTPVGGAREFTVPVNFTDLFEQLGAYPTALDDEEIRVVEFNPFGVKVAEIDAWFAPAADYDATENAAGDVHFRAFHANQEAVGNYFFVYFDTQARHSGKSGAPPAPYVPEPVVMGDRSGAVMRTLLKEDGSFTALSFLDDAAKMTEDYDRGVASFDMDGDGDTDIVFSSGRKLYSKECLEFPYVFGDEKYIDEITDNSAEVSGIATGDFDGDGDNDFVVGTGGESNNSPIYLFQNDGTGLFERHYRHTLNGPTAGKSAGDMDGDGNLDCVVAAHAGYYEAVWILYGDGNGGFPGTIEIFVEPGLHGIDGVAVADFNGDGDLDIIFDGYQEGNNDFLWYLPGPNFTDPMLAQHVPGFPSFGNYEIFLDDFDYNRDGRPDLVLGRRDEAFVAPGLGDFEFGDLSYIKQTADTTNLLDVFGVASTVYLPGSGQLRRAETAPSQSRGLQLVWNTGTTAAGPYRAVGILLNGVHQIASAHDDFDILATDSLTAEVRTDKPEYGANELVRIDSRALSGVVNKTLSGLTATVEIVGPGSVSRYQDVKPEFYLLPMGDKGFKDAWNTAAFEPGAYEATITIEGTAINPPPSATAEFTVRPSTDDCAGLVGAVTAAPREVEQSPVRIDWSATNKGNVDFDPGPGTSLAMEVVIVDPDTNLPVQEPGPYTHAFSLDKGATDTDGFNCPLTGLAGGKWYSAVARYRVDGWGAERYCPLAHAPFKVIDAEPPVVAAFLNPVNGDCKGSAFDLDVQITDGISGVSYAEYRLSTDTPDVWTALTMTAGTSQDGTWHAAVTTQSEDEGTRTLTVRARDAVGNDWDPQATNNPRSITIQIDRTPPQVAQFSTPTQGACEGPRFDLDVELTDALCGVDAAEYRLSTDPAGVWTALIRTAGTPQEGTWHGEVTTESQDEGTVTLTVRARDAVGNDWDPEATNNPRSITIQIDRTPPEVAQFITPVADACAGPGFDLDVQLTDALCGVDAAEYRLSTDPPDEWTALVRTAGTEQDGTWHADVTTQSEDEGTRTLTVRARDLAGNDWDPEATNNPRSISIKIDRTAPAVAEFLTPEADDCVAETFDLDVRLTDALCGVDAAYYRLATDPANTWTALARTAGTEQDGTWHAAVTTQTEDEGTGTITVRAVDLVGNDWTLGQPDNPDDSSVRIDRTPPEITVTPTITEDQVFHTSITLRVSVDDETELVEEQCWFELNGDPKDFDTDYELDDSADYTVEVHAEDCAGHETDLELPFRIQLFDMAKATDPALRRVLVRDGSSSGVTYIEDVLDDSDAYRATVTSDNDFLSAFRSGVYPVWLLDNAALGGAQVHAEMEADAFAGEGLIAVRRTAPSSNDMDEVLGINFRTSSLNNSSYDYYQSPSPVSATVTSEILTPAVGIAWPLPTTWHAQILAWMYNSGGSIISQPCQGLSSITYGTTPPLTLVTGQEYDITLALQDYIGLVDTDVWHVTIPATGPYGAGTGSRADGVLLSATPSAISFRIDETDHYRLEDQYYVTLTVTQGQSSGTRQGMVTSTCTAQGTYNGFLVVTKQQKSVYGVYSAGPTTLASGVHRYGAGGGVSIGWDLDGTIEWGLGQSPVDTTASDLLLDSVEFLSHPADCPLDSREVVAVAVTVTNQSPFAADVRVTETLPSDAHAVDIVYDPDITDVDPPVVEFTIAAQIGAEKTITYLLHVPSDVDLHSIGSDLEVDDPSGWTEAGSVSLSCEVVATEWERSSDLRDDLSDVCDTYGGPACSAETQMALVADPENSLTLEERIYHTLLAIEYIKTITQVTPVQKTDLRIHAGHVLRLWQIVSEY